MLWLCSSSCAAPMSAWACAAGWVGFAGAAGGGNQLDSGIAAVEVGMGGVLRGGFLGDWGIRVLRSGGCRALR